ncbi:MAG: hypothetical protein KDI88_02685 [Gammaproteobacteria bacterium]|nr:hypothetical protein [Gammaproteobacteria bacterium]
MSPEFADVLEGREKLGLVFTFLPLALAIWASFLALTSARKTLALIAMLGLAILSILVPVASMAVWWGLLEEAATTDEDTAWLLSHDGGGLLVGPIFLTWYVGLLWMAPLAIFLIRILFLLLRWVIRKRKRPGFDEEPA